MCVTVSLATHFFSGIFLACQVTWSALFSSASIFHSLHERKRTSPPRKYIARAHAATPTSNVPNAHRMSAHISLALSRACAGLVRARLSTLSVWCARPRFMDAARIQLPSMRAHITHGLVARITLCHRLYFCAVSVSSEFACEAARSVGHARRSSRRVMGKPRNGRGYMADNATAKNESK